MSTQEAAFHKLSYYTFAQSRDYFIHQHIVDAYAAQTADETTKSIKITFALVGLYLYLEKGYTGREVQLFHMKMASNKIQWPVIILPKERGEITVFDVLKVSDVAKDTMIQKWCEAVWESYAENRKRIVEIVKHYQPTL